MEMVGFGFGIIIVAVVLVIQEALDRGAERRK